MCKELNRLLLLAAAILGVFYLTSATNLDAQQNTVDTKKPVQITLYPAPEIKPALKYRLLPPITDTRPGNAAVWWNRIPAERTAYFKTFYEGYDEKGPWAQIEKWKELPINDTQEKEIRRKLVKDYKQYLLDDAVFSDMDRAARYESCDWQFPIHEGNVIAVLLPEVQENRTYGRLLSGKAHLEIAEGKYSEAARTLQTGYTLGRHDAQGQTLIHALVGTTIAGLMTEQVQVWIQQPDGPNLYWALSALPRPLIDFRPGWEAESKMLYLQFPELQNLEEKRLSPEQWRDLLNSFTQKKIKMLNATDAESRALPLLIINGYPKAKRYLIEKGRSAEEVEAMPVAQVILLYTVKIYDELCDSQFKWLFLPASEAAGRLNQVERELRSELMRQPEIIPVAELLIPATVASKRAEMRNEWQMALLRVFEAMRLYAASHNGTWPEHLSDITDVPVPNNPIDGKPFFYQLRGNKAIINSEIGPSYVPWQYEMTLMP